MIRDERLIQDHICADHHSRSKFLSKNASIAAEQPFESAIVKIINGCKHNFLPVKKDSTKDLPEKPDWVKEGQSHSLGFYNNFGKDFFHPFLGSVVLRVQL